MDHVARIQTAQEYPAGSAVRVRIRNDDGAGATWLRGRVIEVDASGVLLEESADLLHTLDWNSIEDVEHEPPSEVSPKVNLGSSPMHKHRPEAPRPIEKPLQLGVPAQSRPNRAWNARTEPYRRAKEAEHYARDPLQFEHWLKVTIKQRGADLPSAVKDLAWLLACQGKTPDALDLLRKHRTLFKGSQRDGMENLNIAILSNARQFGDAAELCERFSQKASPDRVLSLRRQKAVMLRAAGDLQGAAHLTREVLKVTPGDPGANLLLEHLVGDGLGDDLTLADLSEMARFVLRNTARRGMSHTALERGIYDAADFLRVQAQLSLSERSRVRGELLITLAWLCFEAPGEGPRTNPLAILCDAFLNLGRAALEDHLLDSAGAFASEALLLSARENGNQIDFALQVLVATYESQKFDAGSQQPDESLASTLANLRNLPESRERFVDDLACYAALSQDVIDALIVRSRTLSELAQVLPAEDEMRAMWYRERKRLRDETAQLDAVRERPFVLAEFQAIAIQLRKASSSTRFESDRAYLRELADALELSAMTERNRDRPTDVLAVHDSIQERLAVMTDRITIQPTRLSVEQILRIVELMRDAIRLYRDDLVARARPLLRLRNLLEDAYNIQLPDRSVVLALELGSDEGGVPVSDLHISIQKAQHVKSSKPVFLDQPLREAETREISFSIVLNHTVSAVDTFLVTIRVRYRDSLTQEDGEHQFELTIHVRPSAAFDPITPNPYSLGAGGRAVTEPQMFFGRAEALREIIETVGQGPLGQCVVLYGEARCGKSSVMHQLERQLAVSCVVVRITLEILTPQRFACALVEECLRLLRLRTANITAFGTSWPTSLQIAEDPLGVLIVTLRELQSAIATTSTNRIVLLLDEFGIIHQRIRERDLPATFMEQWRGMLESDIFSAVVAGRDTMLEFRRDFWPAFARSQMYPLIYLSAPEAADLAEHPLPLEGRSRYRGGALDRIYELTAGHPFYTQVLCDSLVRTLNAERTPFVTEMHVQLALSALVKGRARLPAEKLDPLIAGANPSASLDVRNKVLALLGAIAKGVMSIENERNDPEVAGLIQTMLEKEILIYDRGGRLAIRVRLFDAWLRSMPDQEFLTDARSR